MELCVMRNNRTAVAGSIAPRGLVRVPAAREPRVGDELEATRTFVQVVRSGGFSRAAKALGKSTSALSRKVRELERELGTALLMRTTRRIHLTEAGRLYLAHGEQLLAAQRTAVDAVVELTGGVPRGTLRVSMPVSVGERLLAPRLADWRTRYPDLKLEIDLSDRNVPLVQGGFDLAIRVGRMADSSLRAQLLGKVARRIVASPAYVAAYGAPRHPRELAAHACIVNGVIAGPVEWGFHRKDAAEAESLRVEVEGVVLTTSPSLAVQLAVGGHGVLRSIEWVMRRELERGELVEVMDAWSCDAPGAGGLPVWALFAQAADMEPPLKSRLFVELVREVMEEDVLMRAPVAKRGRKAR
jgi:DNA-binding transcriptional LysR family regulator